MSQQSSGDFEQCPACRAPALSPFPEDWAMDLIKRGPPEGPVVTSLMPHSPRCIMQPIRFAPHEGIAMRIPGYAVICLGLNMDEA